MSLDDLLKNEDKLEPEIGAMFIGERVVMRGLDLHHDLCGMNFFKVYTYAITGKFLDDNQVKFWEFIFNLTGYPEIRLWPNRVAAYAASQKSTPSLSVAAGISTSEANLYGRGPESKLFNFLKRAKINLDNGANLKDIIDNEISLNKYITGFGRPTNIKADERIPYMMKFLYDNKLTEKYFLKLTLEIEKILNEKGLKMNACAIVTAAAADMDITISQFNQIMSLSFINGIIASYGEGLKYNGKLLPVRCDRIHNDFKKTKTWK